MSNITEAPSVMSRTAVVSLSSGILFIIATLIAVALLNLPRAADAAGTRASCPLAEVALDPGYGLTRTALQPVCHDGANQSPAGNSVAK